MKSTVEKLSPTRVRINVEVPFAELQPDFDRAYKELAKTGAAARFPAGQGAGQASGGPRRPRRGAGAVVNDVLPAATAKRSAPPN